jgi:esterase/lipase
MGVVKKRVFKAVALTGALLATVFALGPTPRVDTAVATPALPKDLDRFLAEREAKFSDITPGCEQTISWVNSATKAKTPISVVYLHGFSATRQETAPLCARVAERLKANRYEARLTGHGRSADAFGEGSASAWLRDGVEALAIGRRIGDRVVVIGCSTGGTLATWLAATGHDADLLAVVLISPNYGTRSQAARLLTWPWGEQVARLSQGEYRSWTAANDAHARYWTTRYPSRVLVDMQALVDLANGSDLSRLQTPTQVIYSPKDAVIDPGFVTERFPQIGASVKELMAFTDSTDPSQHCLAGDVLSPGTTDGLAGRIAAFVEALNP